MSHSDTKSGQKVSHSEDLVIYNAMQNLQILIEMFVCATYKLFGCHFDSGFDLKKVMRSKYLKASSCSQKTSLCDTYVEPSFSSILDELTY